MASLLPLQVGDDGCVNNNMGTYMDKIMVPIMAMMMVRSTPR
jgi:hypothetical protein